MKSDREDSYNPSEFFSPPLWRQRRSFIQDILNKHHIETVIDYGCGEGSVMSFLISDTENKLTKMAGIDIDSEVLEEVVDRCTPYKSDFDQLRSRPLEIDIFQGSIGIADDRLKNHQAIVCSEVIEHVYSDVLDVFLELTLGVYHPLVLIVTTPNSEYNVNFPDLKYNTPKSKFRHDDHKFEWTRKEFESWCHEGAKKYNYNTEYHGIGLLHQKYDQLENGHCTQACVFTRSKDFVLPKADIQLGSPHQLLRHIEFPYYNQEKTPRNQILEELDHFIEALCKAENYMNKKPKNELQYENAAQADLDLTTIDWESFNISKYDIQESASNTSYTTPSSPPTTTTHISILNLWSILRLQQICDSKENMIAILKSSDNERDFYKLIDDDNTLVVSRSFEWDDDSDSVKSFSSREDW